jgi:hypothetical protein
VREFVRRGVIIRTIINNLTFDGSTTEPMAQAVRDSLIAFMAAMAQPKRRPLRKRSEPVSSMPRQMTTALSFVAVSQLIIGRAIRLPST